MAEARRADGPVEWDLVIEDSQLLPGRLARGRVIVVARKPVSARRLRVELVGTEHWQHEQASTDARGNLHTEIVTEHEALPRVPIDLLDEVALAAGERRELPFEVPTPPLGPASLDAKVAGVEWTLEARLDRPGRPDSGIALPVRIAQPTALLRAGVVRLGEFALYESVDVADKMASGSLELTPAPLCLGERFAGRLRLHLGASLRLQEIRLVIATRIRSTVGGGRDEEIEVWRGLLSGPMVLAAGEHELPIAGELPDLAVPTVELPHGRADAVAHATLAIAWARDAQLTRDVALCTTTEL